MLGVGVGPWMVQFQGAAVPADPIASNLVATVLDETSASLVVHANKSDGDVFAVVINTATGTLDPSAAQIIAGTDGGDAAPAWDHNQGVSQAGVQTFAGGVTGLTEGQTYRAYAVYRDGDLNVSNVVESGDFVPADVTAPIVSSVEIAATGTTTATVTFNTDTGEGDARFIVYESDDDTPTLAEIKAGSVGEVQGLHVVNASGPQSIDIVGLSEGTDYLVAVVHTDVAGNDSNVGVALVEATTDSTYAESWTRSDSGVGFSSFSTAGRAFNAEKTVAGGLGRVYSNAFVEGSVSDTVTLELIFGATTTATSVNVYLSSTTNSRSTVDNIDPSGGGTFTVTVDISSGTEPYSILLTTGSLGVIDLVSAQKVENVFTPADLSPLLWFTPGDESTVTLDALGFLTDIDDQSGNSNDGSQSNSNLYPEYGYRVGGVKSLGFSGADNALGLGGLLQTAWTPGDDFWCAFTVQRGPQRLKSGSSIRPIIASGTASNTEISIGTRDENTSADSTFCYSNGTAVTQTAAGTFSAGDRVHCIFEYSKNNHARLYVDGTLVIDDTTNVAVTPGVLYIGGSVYNDARKFNGLVPEVFGGNGALTSDQRDDINTYLAKYDTGTSQSLLYELSGLSTLTKDGNQGAAISSDGFVFACSETNATSDFTVTTYNTDMSSSLQTYDTEVDLPAAATQSNSLHFDEAADKLYGGANNYPTTPAQGWVTEYDVNTTTGALTFVAYHDVGAYWNEGCAKHDGRFFTVYHDDWAIHEYDASWNFVARHVLEVSNPARTGEYLLQGIVFVDDIAYVGIHNANTRELTLYGFHWTGTTFHGVTTGIYPGDHTGQGFDIDGTRYVAGGRLSGSAASPRVIEGTANFNTATVG